jgi:hypothetical protein
MLKYIGGVAEETKHTPRLAFSKRLVVPTQGAGSVAAFAMKFDPGALEAAKACDLEADLFEGPWVKATLTPLTAKGIATTITTARIEIRVFFVDPETFVLCIWPDDSLMVIYVSLFKTEMPLGTVLSGNSANAARVVFSSSSTKAEISALDQTDKRE